MLQRLIGILRLDIPTYEEIEHDKSAISQAALIVGLVSLLSAIGQALGPAGKATGFTSTLLSAFLGWWIGSWVVYKVGTAFFKGEATHGEMLRVLGFAQAPLMLTVLTPIPLLGPAAALIGAIWSLCTYFIAVRQGLDISNTSTVLTVLATILVYFLVFVAIGIIITTVAVMLGLVAAI